MNYFYDDFTEENYRRLLKIAKQNYEFIRVTDYRVEDSPGKVIINRHDLDSSVHRAAKLSAIEKDERVFSVYFVYLHSLFYNVFEKGIVELLRGIVRDGHEIGLHFDPFFYDIDKSMRDEFEARLLYEKQFLEALLDVSVSAFSFHNPDKGGWTSFGDERVCGIINMYSDYFKEHYSYCSDSDGHWRYKRLEDVLTGAVDNRLQILIHPEWWTPEVMKPRERIMRCLEGRTSAVLRFYDDNMRAMDRANEK